MSTRLCTICQQGYNEFSSSSLDGVCIKCYYNKQNGPRATHKLNEQPPNENPQSDVEADESTRRYGQKAVETLRTFAWLNLIGGFFVAIYVWSTMAAIEVQGQFGIHHESNPLGIITGIAFLIEAVFGFVFLLVVCSMAENIIEIRKKIK